MFAVYHFGRQIRSALADEGKFLKQGQVKRHRRAFGLRISYYPFAKCCRPSRIFSFRWMGRCPCDSRSVCSEQWAFIFCNLPGLVTNLNVWQSAIFSIVSLLVSTSLHYTLSYHRCLWLIEFLSHSFLTPLGQLKSNRCTSLPQQAPLSPIQRFLNAGNSGQPSIASSAFGDSILVWRCKRYFRILNRLSSLRLVRRVQGIWLRLRGNNSLESKQSWLWRSAFSDLKSDYFIAAKN